MILCVPPRSALALGLVSISFATLVVPQFSLISLVVIFLVKSEQSRGLSYICELHDARCPPDARCAMRALSSTVQYRAVGGDRRRQDHVLILYLREREPTRPTRLRPTVCWFWWVGRHSMSTSTSTSTSTRVHSAPRTTNRVRVQNERRFTSTDR